jgi:hypothetical protein
MTVNPATGRPIVTPGTHRISDADLRALIARHGFANPDQAFAIVQRESGGYVDVVCDTVGMTPQQLRDYWGYPAGEERSVGLWQINVWANKQFSDMGDGTSGEGMKDPEANAAAAFTLSGGGKNFGQSGPWRKGG